MKTYNLSSMCLMPCAGTTSHLRVELFSTANICTYVLQYNSLGICGFRQSPSILIFYQLISIMEFQ